jgi:exonuclease I
MPARHVTTTSSKVDLLVACSNSYAAKPAATMKTTPQKQYCDKKSTNKTAFLRKHGIESTLQKARKRQYGKNRIMSDEMKSKA